MQIVYCSNDRSQEEYDEYLKEQGDWLSLPFKSPM